MAATRSTTKRHVATIVLALAVASFAVVVLREVTHPRYSPPPIGTAVQIAGQRTNILPQPDFLAACSSTHYDNSRNCTDTVVSAINNARVIEGLPTIALPSNWYVLTPEEQLFVATNLERSARGLVPISAMSESLNNVAGAAARNGEDPKLSAGGIYTSVAANWIQGYSNPLEAVYEWVYDDGVGSSNLACTASNLSPCWAHRANVLVSLSCEYCSIGAAYAPRDSSGKPCSYAEVLVETTTYLPAAFTWQQEQPYLSR
ncbi:MAG: hypothetical protein M1134_06005 [Actinobacteria bacterium]|nr:hypothetical protein [Actinomycetota bacterium]MCL5445370.1 hypothetical protein [Actinomycetota bacterium]